LDFVYTNKSNSVSTITTTQRDANREIITSQVEKSQPSFQSFSFDFAPILEILIHL